MYGICIKHQWSVKFKMDILLVYLFYDRIEGDFGVQQITILNPPERAEILWCESGLVFTIYEKIPLLKFYSVIEILINSGSNKEILLLEMDGQCTFFQFPTSNFQLYPLFLNVCSSIPISFNIF